jgi:GT2 family glycosyltransferase
MELNSIENLIDIIIVNWNSGSCLEDLMNSMKQVQYPEHINTVFIVDNNSTDSSLEFLTSTVAPFKIELIHNQKNVGFGEACNIASKKCQAKYLLFLNPDTLLFKDSLDGPKSFLDKNPDYAACGIQLLDENRVPTRSCARIPSFINFLYSALGLDILFSQAFHGYFMREWDHLDSRDTDHIIGAFYLIQRDIFLKLGGFDPQFFLYFEDLDLSTLLKGDGHKIRYLASTQALHIGGGCSKNISTQRLYHSLKSKILYITKHMPFYKSILLMFIILFVEPFFRTIFFLFNRSSKDVSNSFIAQWLLFKDLFSKSKKLVYRHIRTP